MSVRSNGGIASDRMYSAHIDLMQRYFFERFSTMCNIEKIASIRMTVYTQRGQGMI